MSINFCIGDSDSTLTMESVCALMKSTTEATVEMKKKEAESIGSILEMKAEAERAVFMKEASRDDEESKTRLAIDIRFREKELEYQSGIQEIKLGANKAINETMASTYQTMGGYLTRKQKNENDFAEAMNAFKLKEKEDEHKLWVSYSADMIALKKKYAEREAELELRIKAERWDMEKHGMKLDHDIKQNTLNQENNNSTMKNRHDTLSLYERVANILPGNKIMNCLLTKDKFWSVQELNGLV